MSQRNSNQKSKRLMSQPLIVPRQLHDSDSEQTISTSPSSNAADLDGGSPTLNMTTSPTQNPEPNDERIFIRPIGTNGFEPYDGNRKIIESITRYYPEAFKTFNSAPRSMKDIWFNEFKKPVSGIPKMKQPFGKYMRKKLPKEFLTLWDRCASTWQKKERLGEEPSHATVFQETHKRKKTGEFVCKRAQQVMVNVTQIQQTQLELGDAMVWYEAASGLNTTRKMHIDNGF